VPRARYFQNQSKTRCDSVTPNCNWRCTLTGSSTNFITAHCSRDSMPLFCWDHIFLYWYDSTRGECKVKLRGMDLARRGKTRTWLGFSRLLFCFTSPFCIRQRDHRFGSSSTLKLGEKDHRFGWIVLVSQKVMTQPQYVWKLMVRARGKRH